MRIVIIGAGEVGFNVAKNLSSDGHDIVLIEDDELRAAKIENELDVLVVKGNGARPSVLERAGIKQDSNETQLLIACTNKDEVNITACLIAKKMGVPNVIARAVGLEFTDRSDWAMDLGIDMLISPERSVAKEIEALLDVKGAMQAVEIAGGQAGIYVFRVAPDSSVVGITLMELRRRNPNLITLIVCIQRDDRTFIPKAKDVIFEGDICYSICYRNQVHELGPIFQPSLHKKLKKVFIIGGGKIGFQTARRLILRSAGVEIRLFEENKEKSRRIASELPQVLVICGDGADSDLLISEGIESADGFVATTEEDEKNLMLSVLGKTLGASKSIAIVKRSNYMGMTNHIPVDSIVNRNQALADVIIRNVRYPGSSRVLTVFKEISAEVLEFVIPPDSPAVGKRLMDICMPEHSVIGLLERRYEMLIPTGLTELKAFDKVVLFAGIDIMPQAIRKLDESSI